MKLKKISNQVESTPAAKQPSEDASSGSGLPLNRRDFLRQSGILAGGAALATGLAPGMMKKASLLVIQPKIV